VQRLTELTHALLAGAQGAKIFGSARHQIRVQLHRHTPRALPADRHVEEHLGVSAATKPQGRELGCARTLGRTETLHEGKHAGRKRRSGVAGELPCELEEGSNLTSPGRHPDATDGETTSGPWRPPPALTQTRGGTGALLDLSLAAHRSNDPRAVAAMQAHKIARPRHRGRAHFCRDIATR